jgi:hypothetical protein
MPLWTCLGFQRKRSIFQQYTHSASMKYIDFYGCDAVRSKSIDKWPTPTKNGCYGSFELWVSMWHRNLKSRSRTKSGKVKKDLDIKCPKNERRKTIQVLNTVARKIWRGNSIYDMKWGAHTLGTFPPNIYTFMLLNFRFLRHVNATADCFP